MVREGDGWGKFSELGLGWMRQRKAHSGRPGKAGRHRRAPKQPGTVLQVGVGMLACARRGVRLLVCHCPPVAWPSSWVQVTRAWSLFNAAPLEMARRARSRPSAMLEATPAA